MMRRPKRAVLIICLLVLFNIPSIAWSSTVFRLAPKTENILWPVTQGVANWERNAGRYGDDALRITPSTKTQSVRFLLFEKPQRLPSPDQYRAEVWVKAENGECHLDFILYDASTGTERVRYTINAKKNTPQWCYGACDIPIQEELGHIYYNIEVIASGEDVLIDGLRVNTSNSILTNGDFIKIDESIPLEVPDIEKDQRTGLPWGWRRLYRGSAREEEANGQFTAVVYPSGNMMWVKKEECEYILSAEPINQIDNASVFVARAFVEGPSTILPTLVLRQYGSKGLVSEDRSVWVSEKTPGQDETLVTTACVERHPETQRVVLLLQFPSEAGVCRVRSVQVCPLEERSADLKIYADQVGYNQGEPIRFIVGTSLFPPDGSGSFVLTDESGRKYEGELVSSGRSVGQYDSDWGSYYFEGFTPDAAPGHYSLEVALGGQTALLPSVAIGSGLRYRETGELAYRFYSIQRCGCKVPGWHEECHMDDGKLPDGTHVDVTGGYHNAGDLHKHTGDNTPVSVYGMISTYDKFKEFFEPIDRNGNGRSDLLEESLWGADWLRKMVDPKTGRMWMNVTNDIDYYGIPEHDTDGIIGTGDDRLIGTQDAISLGAFVMASWAVLSRHVSDENYLVSAERVWSAYEDRILSGYDPRHIFAALELYETTQNGKYRNAADKLIENLFQLQNEDGWYAPAPGGGPGIRIVDEGTTPAALAFYGLKYPDSPLLPRVEESLRRYFEWSLRLADNPFGIIRHYSGEEPFYFKSRDEWFGGSNSAYCSVAWAAYLTAQLFVEREPTYANRLRVHAANQIHWILGMNPLGLCMFEGKGNSHLIYYHHLYAEIPGHPRGDVPGIIPNGIIREPGNADRPWFDLRTRPGSLPGCESAEPWLPHNGYYLLMLSAE
ncbi:MAG: glycoside hydrolase family 9 protein [bacterium]